MGLGVGVALRERNRQFYSTTEYRKVGGCLSLSKRGSILVPVVATGPRQSHVREKNGATPDSVTEKSTDLRGGRM